MPSLPSTGALSISQINAEFGLGNNLGAYKGTKYYLDNNRRGFFPSGGNAYIDISAFRSKRATSPVTSGSWSRTTGGNYNFTFPMFNVLTVTVVGGQGGQQGGTGLYVNGPSNGQVYEFGGAGLGGGASNFGSFVRGDGGVGNGFNGQTATFVFNVDQNSSYFDLYNTNASVTVGSGGSGGIGGMNRLWNSGLFGGTYEDWFRANNGASGSAGSVTISWT